MSYPLRLPEHLESEARERSAAIGISFNAFICVCVEAYLRGSGRPQASEPVEREQRPRKGGKQSEPQTGSENPDWRFFHNVDYWPLMDPDPAWSVRDA